MISDHDDRSDAIARAPEIAYAVTEARDLQDTPANDMTPMALAERARALPAWRSRSWAATRSSPPGMGAFAAVAQGTYAEPQLITLRYDAGDDRPLIGAGRQGGHLRQRRHLDQAGGRDARDEVRHVRRRRRDRGRRAIAALELPVRVLAVVGATENMQSGRRCARATS